MMKQLREIFSGKENKSMNNKWIEDCIMLSCFTLTKYDFVALLYNGFSLYCVAQ